MGGLDWVAFPIACDALGVRDPERILAGLVAIRDWFAERERERRKLNEAKR